MGVGGNRVLASALRPVKTEKTVSHRQNNHAKGVGTPVIQSNWCTLITAVSTAVQKRISESEGLTVEEQLGVTGKLHCHHHNDSYIKTGSDESHFNFINCERQGHTRQCPQTTTFLKRKRAEVESSRGPSAYQHNALPLGQTGLRPS